MLSKCLNPDCKAPFNYREGRLVRFSASPIDESIPSDPEYIVHFWLCGACSEHYVFEFDPKAGMMLRPRCGVLGEKSSPRLAATA